MGAVTLIGVELGSQQCFEVRLVYWTAAVGFVAALLQCLMYFSSYLIVFFEAVAFEKPLYIIDSLRSSLGSYDQTVFVEMQILLMV